MPCVPERQLSRLACPSARSQRQLQGNWYRTRGTRAASAYTRNCQGSVAPAARSCASVRMGSSLVPGAGAVVWNAGTSSVGKAHWAEAPSVKSVIGRASRTVRMVLSVREAPRRAKKDGTNIWGARAGRPVTQLVLKLSTGGFHLNRSTKDRRKRSPDVAQSGNFL